jgi:hypothetical protein
MTEIAKRRAPPTLQGPTQALKDAYRIGETNVGRMPLNMASATGWLTATSAVGVIVYGSFAVVSGIWHPVRMINLLNRAPEAAIKLLREPRPNERTLDALRSLGPPGASPTWNDVNTPDHREPIGQTAPTQPADETTPQADRELQPPAPSPASAETVDCSTYSVALSGTKEGIVNDRQTVALLSQGQDWTAQDAGNWADMIARNTRWIGELEKMLAECMEIKESKQTIPAPRQEATSLEK